MFFFYYNSVYWHPDCGLVSQVCLCIKKGWTDQFDISFSHQRVSPLMGNKWVIIMILGISFIPWFKWVPPWEGCGSWELHWETDLSLIPWYSHWAFSMTALTNHHKLSGLNQYIFTHSSEVQKTTTSFPGHDSSHSPSRVSREESVSLPFPASRAAFFGCVDSCPSL